jgi:hypothetical protein
MVDEQKTTSELALNTTSKLSARLWAAGGLEQR